MLELRQITKRYRERRNGQPVAALDGVDLTLQADELLVVQGPSGSGKSTLLLIAGGLLRPSDGQVTFAGQDIYGLSPADRNRWRAENVGFVFQQFHLIPYLTVMENVLAPTLGMAQPEAARRADELIERFGLASRRHHVPSELSAGEQQRVALARALLHQPRVLFCDEPTGNLDDQNGQHVLQCLCGFRGQGRSVLLVTHNTAAVARGDRCVRLCAGRLEKA